MANIPALMPLDTCKASGSGLVKIESRTNGGLLPGTFKIEIDVAFNPAINDTPIGNLRIKTDLSEGINSEFKTTNFFSINVHGKHNPTLFITSNVDENLPNYKGCKIWLMIANTKNTEFRGSADIVSFTVQDNKGQVIQYGTGTLIEGDIKINNI